MNDEYTENPLSQEPDSIERGFAKWRREGYRGHEFLLPVGLAEDLVAEENSKREAKVKEREAAYEAKEAELERKETEEAQRKKESARQAALAPVIVGRHVPEPDEVAPHRVFVDIEAVRARVLKLRLGAANGDRDMAKRETKSLEAALALGPERSIVRPPNWRALLDELTCELPAFRAPLELLKQSFALSERCGGLAVAPPMLLLGPPGVGKSYFARRLAEAMRCGHAWLALDQRTAGTTLRGTDSHWSNAKAGLLFEHLALGRTANPVFVLDEIDKAARAVGRDGVDMLSQLYSVLEPETARHVEDTSFGIELDASQILYVATANDLGRLDAPMLSRFEVFQIGMPTLQEQGDACRRIVASVLARLDPARSISVSEGVYVLLALYSPRVIRRAAERALAITVSANRARMSVDDAERALGIQPAAGAVGAQRATPTRHLH